MATAAEVVHAGGVGGRYPDVVTIVGSTVVLDGSMVIMRVD